MPLKVRDKRERPPLRGLSCARYPSRSFTFCLLCLCLQYAPKVHIYHFGTITHYAPHWYNTFHICYSIFATFLFLHRQTPILYTLCAKSTTPSHQHHSNTNTQNAPCGPRIPGRLHTAPRTPHGPRRRNLLSASTAQQSTATSVATPQRRHRLHTPESRRLEPPDSDTCGRLTTAHKPPKTAAA